MLIGAYGEFWDARLVDWGLYAWGLYGKSGQNLPTLRVVNFRRARGVYVLYDDHGAYYAGLARGKGGIGQRLLDHRYDKHKDKWQRFSWYAFDPVSKRHGDAGFHEVERKDGPVPASGEKVLKELEALLITVLGTRGQVRMKFQAADRWEQIPFYDLADMRAKLAGRQ